MKYTHYSPDADVFMAGGSGLEMASAILREAAERKEKGQMVGIMATEENMDKYEGFKVISLGSGERPEEIASRLFMALRLFDEMKMDVILSETIEEKEIGRAVMNRLKKAAGNRWIERK
jgi:L-threonylcarbamoyladenylate synthase